MRARFLSLTRQTMLNCVGHCLPLLFSVALRRPRLPRRPRWPPCARPSILSLVSKQMCPTTSATAEMACSSHFARISWFFFTVHSWLLSLHRPMLLSDTRRFQPLSNRVSVLRNRIKRACVLVERTNGKINLNRVFRLRWLCEGRACRVQLFMLSLSVFL